MYVLLKGRLGVQLQEADGTNLEIDELQPVVCVGEMALLTGQPRTAMVYALNDSELVAFSRGGFERLTVEHPDRVCEFAKSISFRIQRTQLAGILPRLFGELDPDALQDIQAELEWQQLSAGEPLFHQGDPGDSMVILVTGRLCMTAESQEGEMHPLGEIEPGEIVGEFALLTGEPRSASIQATRDSSLVKLSKPGFDRLLEKYPGAMMQITRMLVQRQKKVLQLTRSESKRAYCVALVSMDPQTPLSDLAGQLSNCFADLGSVLYLDSQNFDRVYGREGAAQTTVDDPTHPVLSGWMNQQELKYQLILFVADAEWTAWSQRCIRQADRVLLVNRSNSNPEPMPMEIEIRSLCDAARFELVLLHPSDTDYPSGTSAWLSGRKVAAHHHIRIGDRAHYQRLARHLTGRSLGLVLSGGAAQGFAHVGVLRAMEELGIHADRVGGTSNGAIIGAGHALGLSYENIFEKCRVYANPKAMFDYTLPVSSIMASRKITRAVKDLCEDHQIEDLWHPYFCVSVNLTRAEPVIHRTGPLWKCLRTSSAIPGVFTPVQHNGDVLMDGGMMDNFPVDVMHDFYGKGPIIGVDVSCNHNLPQALDFGTSIDGWRVLLSRINPFSPPARVPSLVETLMRSMEVTALYQNKLSNMPVDLLIQPAVQQYASLDFAAYEPIVEIGYQAALPVLREWLDQ